MAPRLFAPLLVAAFALRARCSQLADVDVNAIFRPGSRSSKESYEHRDTLNQPTPLRDVTDVRLWPLPANVSHSSSDSWTFIAGPNVAAVGPDCPFLNRGPADSLQVCQNACSADGQCNLVNFDPTLPDCVFRSCVDPLHPQISAYNGYSVYGLSRASYYLVPPASGQGVAAGTDTVGGRALTPFEFQSVGYTDDVLTAGMQRYSAIVFTYGPGNTSSIPQGAVISPGIRINVTAPAGSDPSRLDADTDESYTLTAPDDSAGGWVTLTAISVFGALHGLETFSQLVSYNLTGQTYSLTYTAVQDQPRFSYRGLLVDTSRHYITPEAIKLILDQMGYLKLNALHWHISDDQSWPLELTSFPLLAQRAAYSNYSHTYTHAHVKDLVAYARMRGIRIIPEFDSPSHFSSLFQAYPQYAATSYDQNNNSYLCMVDVTNDYVMKTFLPGIWSEIASLFPDSHMFIGGDEFWACWSQSPTVAAWMKAHKMTVYETYYWYERQIIDMVRSNGRQTMAWLDVAGFPAHFSGNYSGYPDVTLDVWSGCYSGRWQDDVSSLTSQNMSVVVSGPFYITELNDGNANSTPHFTWQQMYSTDLWNFTGSDQPVSPDQPGLIRADLVKGGELCDWDDAAQTDSGDLWMQLTPYMIGFAEAMWSPQGVTANQQPDEGRAHGHRCRMIARGIPSHPIYAFGTYCPFEYAPSLPVWDNSTALV